MVDGKACDSFHELAPLKVVIVGRIYDSPMRASVLPVVGVAGCVAGSVRHKIHLDRLALQCEARDVRSPRSSE